MSSVATEAPPQSAKHTEAQKAIDKAKNLLDARIKRIKNNILPQSPYLLTADGSLTSSYIRHIHPNNSNGWRKNTLFEDNERRLQYLSFKDRSSDLERSGMHAHGAWDNGKGGMALLEEKTSLTSSDATTPHPNQGPRKKITLADYKNKDRSKATVVEARALAGEPKEITKAVEKRVEQTATVAEPTKPQASEHHGDKR